MAKPTMKDNQNGVNSPNRLTALFISLMLIPAAMMGMALLTSLWIHAPHLFEGFFSTHRTALLAMIVVGIGCIIVGVRLAQRITGQLRFLSLTASSIHHADRPSHEIHEPLYPEFHEIDDALKAHQAFHDAITTFIRDIADHSGKKSSPIPPAEQDEFLQTINGLALQIQDIQHVIDRVIDGDLTVGESSGNRSQPGIQHHLRQIVTEFAALIATVRRETELIVRKGSHIHSISMQEAQDTKIVTKRIHDISQSIQNMAMNIQHVAKHLQGQLSTLDETSSSIERTIQSVEEIAHNITQLKSIVEKNAPSSVMPEQTFFSLDMMSNTTKAIEKDANTCMTLSQEAADDAKQGKFVVEQTIESIRHIQQAMAAFFEIVRQLRERSEEVGETLTVISDIADHTNLLAINAAIISSHAGEHGRDFAVIADEISKFAERTRESANEIEDLLRAIHLGFQEAMQAMEKASIAMSGGVDLSYKAGKMLGKISSSIVSTNTMATRIAAATTDQSRENDHIRYIMEELVRLQSDRQEQVNHVLWQLMQAIAQIRGITSEQVEGSTRIAALAQNLEHITRDIEQATNQHVTTAYQIVKAVDNIHRLIERTTGGAEHVTRLSEGLLTITGNLALTMGEFLLSDKRDALQQMLPGVPTIGFVKRGGERFYDAMSAGIRKEAERFGFQVIETNSRYEAATQAEDVNWLLKQPSLQGLVLCHLDTVLAQKLIRKGVERGIPCVAADGNIPTTISVRSDNRENGRLAVEFFIGRLEPYTEIGLLIDPTVESIVQRAEGFQELAEQSAFGIVRIYCDLRNEESLKQSVTAGIEAHPDLQGIFFAHELITTAYLDLLHKNVFPAQERLAAGFDYNPTIEEAIRQNELIGTIVQNPQEIGRQAFLCLHKLIKKDARIEDFDQRAMTIPTIQVTKETLNQLRDDNSIW